MMRKLDVYKNGIYAGALEELENRSYRFRYEDRYFENDKYPSISLTLPKSKQEYTSENLFPFFQNMLPEGNQRNIHSRYYQVSESDHFGLLIATSDLDRIGAVTLKKTNADQ